MPLLPADLKVLPPTISINLQEQFCVFYSFVMQNYPTLFLWVYGFLAVQTHTVVVGYGTIYTGMEIIYLRGKCSPPKCW